MPRLDVGMALQRGVHPAVQPAELRRVLAEQVRPEFRDPGAHAVGIGRQVERPERADLAVADDARVGLDRDDRAVEDVDRLAARPLVAALRAGAARPGRPRCA